MIDHDHVAITVIVPTRINNHARIRGIDTFALRTGDIDPPVIGLGRIIEAGEIVLVGWPDEIAEPNRTTGDRVAGPWAKHTCQCRVFARDAQRRAPRNELAFAAWDDQHGSRWNIWMCVIANRCRVQIVGRKIDDVFRCYAKKTGNTVQTIAVLPLVIGAIDWQDVQILTWL